MPEETIIAAIERFELALETEVRPLVKAVERIDRTKGRLKFAFGGLTAVVVALATLGYIQFRDRQAASVDACRLRNNTPALLRDSALADIDATADLLLEQGVQPNVVALYVERRQDAIPSRDDTDRDCNGDGRLTERDYPQSTTARVGD